MDPIETHGIYEAYRLLRAENEELRRQRDRAREALEWIGDNPNAHRFSVVAFAKDAMQ
jgi:hypothetical protein